MDATHTKPAGFGLPYARAGVDEIGYYVTCPICGVKCRPHGTSDDATKSATHAYQAHFEEMAK